MRVAVHNSFAFCKVNAYPPYKTKPVKPVDNILYFLNADGMKNADVYDNGSGITNQDALQIQSYLLNMVETLEPDKK